jgi:hypothetical protein
VPFGWVQHALPIKEKSFPHVTFRVLEIFVEKRIPDPENGTGAGNGYFSQIPRKKLSDTPASQISPEAFKKEP